VGLIISQMSGAKLATTPPHVEEVDGRSEKPPRCAAHAVDATAPAQRRTPLELQPAKPRRRGTRGKDAGAAGARAARLASPSQGDAVARCFT
jgi:hypothetical protein